MRLIAASLPLPLKALNRLGPRNLGGDSASALQDDVLKGEGVAERARPADHDAIEGHAPAVRASELDALGQGDFWLVGQGAEAAFEFGGHRLQGGAEA